jgi:hypothetical protein
MKEAFLPVLREPFSPVLRTSAEKALLPPVSLSRAPQFLRLGFEGYRKIQVNLRKVADHLSKGIESLGETRGTLGPIWHAE